MENRNSEVSPDDLFIDFQKKGPYSLWWHQHRIVPEGDSNCRMEDQVFYKVPAWFIGRVVHKYLIKNMLLRIFSYLLIRKVNVVVPLLAGTAKTLVVSMLSEKVVLGVLVMLSEWTAAKSTNSLDNRLVF